MFTGLVQVCGSVKSLVGSRLVVGFATGAWADDLELGESVAVNGCCLTVVSATDSEIEFDVSSETLARTAFSRLAAGSSVNLERAMRPMDRFGGHIVQGHVDGVGKLVAVVPQTDGSAKFTFDLPEEGEKYLIDKGSIAIDGVSLTVVEPRGAEFDVWVIPHTLAVTTLGGLSVGSPVNIEYDVLAKHVEKLLSLQ